MDKDTAETLARYMKEHLKRPEKALTIVMTRDIVKAIYELAVSYVAVYSTIKESLKRKEEKL